MTNPYSWPSPDPVQLPPNPPPIPQGQPPMPPGMPPVPQWVTPVLEYGSGPLGAVPCPACGDRRFKKVKWTLWGGALGPKMFSHVACLACGTKYNGKTGRSNATAIAIYLIVSLVLSVAAFFVARGLAR